MKKHIQVCSSRSCAAFGAERVMEKISEYYHCKPGGENDEIALDYCGCLGYCSRSPNVLIDEDHICFDTSPENVISDIEAGGEKIEGEIVDLEELFDDYLDKKHTN